MKISQKKALKKTATFGNIALGDVFYLAGTENEDGSVDNRCLYMKVGTTLGGLKPIAVFLEDGEVDSTVAQSDEVVVVKAHLTVEV